ncbi:hypothetical protein D3C76_604450 [compost metagenome]
MGGGQVGDPVSQLFGQPPAGGAVLRHGHQKLLPSPAPDLLQVRRPALQLPGQLPYGLVTCLVAVPVVDLLEMVDVDDEQGQWRIQLPLLLQLLQQGAPVRQPGQLIEGGELVEMARAAVQPVGGESEQDQGPDQQDDQHQLIVAGTLLIQQLLALVLVLLLQRQVAGLAAGQVHLDLEGGGMLAQGLVEVLPVVLHVAGHDTIGLGVASQVCQQPGLHRLALYADRAWLGRQQLQGQLGLPPSLQGSGPDLGQPGGGLGITQSLIDGLRLLQALPGGVPVSLCVEHHGPVAEDDGAIVGREPGGGQQGLEQLARPVGAPHVDVEPRHVGPDDGLAVGFVQSHHLPEGILIVALGLPVEAEIGIEVAKGHHQAGTLQGGEGASWPFLLELEGGLELGDRLLHLLGTVEGEAIEGMPLGLLLEMAQDGRPELGQQLEGLLGGLGIQGQGNLLQSEVEQAPALLLGTGQPAGAGVVQQGLLVASQGGLGKGSGMEQLHVLLRAGVEALQIADGIPRRLQFSLFQQGGSGLQLGYPEQRQCHNESH